MQRGAQKADDVCTSGERDLLLERLDTMAPTPGGDKFVTRALVTGLLAEATQGLTSYLGKSAAEMRVAMARGEAAIVDEVAAYADAETSELLNYVMHERCSEKAYPNGVRDQGRPPMRLADFMAHDSARRAGLERAHVIALRLYTTAAFRHINDPLRDRQRKAEGRAHPLAATVMFISEAVKKLREVSAKGGAHSATTLWRGLKEIKLCETYATLGGTELAPMSTTSDVKVAADYATCAAGALLFKIHVPDALKHGADLQWLSAFPREAEVLYPPLTYLQPRENFHLQEIRSELTGAKFTVVAVVPDLSAGS